MPRRGVRALARSAAPRPARAGSVDQPEVADVAGGFAATEPFTSPVSLSTRFAVAMPPGVAAEVYGTPIRSSFIPLPNLGAGSRRGPRSGAGHASAASATATAASAASTHPDAAERIETVKLLEDELYLGWPTASA